METLNTAGSYLRASVACVMPVLPAGCGSSMFTGTVTLPSVPSDSVGGMLTVGSGPLSMFAGAPG